MSSTTTSPSPTATGPGGCITAVPGKYGRVPVDACNSYYNFDPNFAAAVLLSAAFGLLSLGHLVLGVAYRKVRFLFFPNGTNSGCGGQLTPGYH